jgi:uncharacterized membrane protein HdeD (DUF308 family)
MIRLILLLLGARPLRTYWWTFAVLSLLCLALGVFFLTDFFDSAIIVITDVIGVLFVIEGAVRLFALAAIGFPNATIPVLKALGFFALGFMAIDVPWDNNIVATIVLGTALILDGLFRWTAAAFIRSVRWRHAVLVGGGRIARSSSAVTMMRRSALSSPSSRAGDMQVVPSAWIERLNHPAARLVDGLQHSAQWWHVTGPDDDVAAIGVYGQYDYVNRNNGVVIVKLSDYGAEEDEAETLAVLRALANAG